MPELLCGYVCTKGEVCTLGTLIRGAERVEPEDFI